MYCKWYQFHNYEYICEKIKCVYLAEEYIEYRQTFKKCKKCGIIKYFQYDSQGGYWGKLNSNEIKILNKRIELDTTANCLIVNYKND